MGSGPSLAGHFQALVAEGHKVLKFIKEGTRTQISLPGTSHPPFQVSRGTLGGFLSPLGIAWHEVLGGGYSDRALARASPPVDFHKRFSSWHAL